MDIDIHNSLKSVAPKVVPVTNPGALSASPNNFSTDKSKIVEAPVEEAVTSLQNFVQALRRDLNFSLDDSSGRVVVKVTDGASGEVIRQLPSEEALRLAESLEQARGLLLRAKA